eukprot:augustus_masked-scaffold_44-processed-gene-0.0-mRNA-1 protein AED:1.00 eAED:1.00 QI:0/0/0/0/1/1/2/0/494
MFEVVKNVSANRFRVKKKSSHSFSEDETKRIFGFSKKMMRRCKLKCVSSKNCTFELNFKFDLKLGKYIFQVKCLDHTGHEVQVNKNERKFQSDLKPAELRMLKYLGVADTPLTSVEVALHPKFPGIYFDKELLKRQLKKAREEGRDSEDNNIQILIKTVKRCLSNAGNFELYYSNDTEGRPRLKGLTFQEQLQVKLKNVYSESIQIDTTHGLSRYIFVAMFPVGVDCFMKTVSFGCTLMQTENHEQVIRGLKDLGLEHTEVMMSDGFLALARVARLLRATLVRFTGCYVVSDNGDWAYIVSETENDVSRLYNVKVRDINGWVHPECSCSTWTNLKLPYRHYARICVRLKRKYIDKVNLLPRWRFQEHPLHEVALKELGRATTPEEGVLNFNVKVPGFKDLKVPKKPGVRFSMLKTACRDLCEEAQHSTDEGWRKAYATVIKMKDALKQNADGNFSDVDMSLSQHSGSTILSPRKRKMRRKGSVVASQSRLNFNT